MRKLAAVLVLLAACEDDRGPAPIALGEDGCDACRMIISEAPYAAQMRSSGKVEKFDDIGCLFERLTGSVSPTELWVVDHPSGRWIDATRAIYVRSKEFKTPMASGLAAFASRPDADAFATKVNGKVLLFDEARSTRRPQ